MAFKWTWPSFSPEFLSSARTQITHALNRGEKPPNIVGEISVAELCLGTKAPELEILGIDELVVGLSRSRSIYRLMYNGDAHLVLSTHVQANPLKVSSVESCLFSFPSVLAANKPLVVPMQIRIAQIRLRGVMSLVVDQEDGMTIKFKSDPLESVTVSSSFDTVEHIKKFLQAQIEGQLRELFSNDLPQIIHQLSLEFLQRAKHPPPLSLSSTSSSSPPVSIPPSVRQTLSNEGSQESESYPLWSPRSMDMEVGLTSLETDQLENHRLHLDHSSSSYTAKSHSSNHHARNPSDGKMSRSHSQKWMGNEPVSGYESEPDAPRVLTRGLGSHEEMDGLGRLGDLPSYGTQVLSRESLRQLSRSAPNLAGESRVSRSSVASGSTTTGSRRRLMGSGFRRLRLAGEMGTSRSSVSSSTFSAPTLNVGRERDPHSYHLHPSHNSNGVPRPPPITTSYHPNVDEEDWIIPQDPRSIVDVRPSDSPVSAHLANLMASNRTISVLNQGIPHTITRADPTARAVGAPSPSPQTSPKKQPLSASTDSTSSASPQAHHYHSRYHHRRRVKDRSPLNSSFSGSGTATGPDSTTAHPR